MCALIDYVKWDVKMGFLWDGQDIIWNCVAVHCEPPRAEKRNLFEKYCSFGTFRSAGQLIINLEYFNARSFMFVSFYFLILNQFLKIPDLSEFVENVNIASRSLFG